MKYFYIKRKTKNEKEVVGGYVFTKGMLCVKNDNDAIKMSNNLIKYYGATMSSKSPDDIKEDSILKKEAMKLKK